MNKVKKQIKAKIAKKKNLGHQTKEEKDRNKSMKKENSKTIDVERLLGTYDLSKNSLATLFPTPFSLDPPHDTNEKEEKENQEKEKENPIKRGLDKLKELI